MSLKEVRLTGTTSSGGALTINAPELAIGDLHAVEWIDGDLADGVDAVLSTQDTASGVAQTLLTLTNANVDKWYYPRATAHDLAGADAEYAATFDIREKPLVNGKLRLVIASGGNAKTGGCIVYIKG